MAISLSPKRSIGIGDKNIRVDRHKNIEDILSNNNNDKVELMSVVYWLSAIAAAKAASTSCSAPFIVASEVATC